MIDSNQIHRYGGPENLKMVKLPSASLSPTQVRIEVAASGVNFADIMMRMGLYPEAPKPPFVPGYEVAGCITEIGKQVKAFQVGDRVLAGTRFGGYTSQIVLPENQVKKTPSRLTDIEAAAIPVNFLTAWFALIEMARIKKGDRVLIQSAAGGVGTAAIQIASQKGAHVSGIIGSTEWSAKQEKVQALGASTILSSQEWEKASDSEAGGYQVILDSTGGESLKRSFRRLAPGGRVITFGVASLVAGSKRSIPNLISTLYHTLLITPFKLMMENKGIYWLNLLQFINLPLDQQGQNPSQAVKNPLTEALDLILERFSDGSYQVVIGKTFPLSEAGAAQTYLQSRSNIGKVVLTPIASNRHP